MQLVRLLNLFIALVSFVLAGALLYPNVAPAEVVKKHSRAARSAATQSRVLTPEDGVRLLEIILARVRNVPQIAMMNKNIHLKSEGEAGGLAVSGAQGPDDYSLAIKPKSKAVHKRARRKQMPTLALLPQSNQYKGGREGVTSRAGSSPSSRLIGSKVRSNKGFWQSDDESNETAAPHASVSNYEENRVVGRGVWEKQAELEEMTDGLSQKSKERIKDSAGKLSEIARFFENSQRVASLSAPQAASEPAQRPAEEIAMEGDRDSSQSGGGAGYGGNLRADQSAARQELKKDAGEVSVHTSALRGKMVKAPATFRSDSFGYGQYRGLGSGDKAVVRDYRLALLPPNVATGIPLVRLGSSAADASKALAAVGGMSRSKIGNWAVWSYKRPGVKKIALQVFVRNGSVEALRIFDSSLVGPSFGVRLTDSLSTVKRRFGEPAFILPEPVAGAGQNYVYPISQVSFLMQRGQANSAPAVASMLIFNVR